MPPEGPRQAANAPRMAAATGTLPERNLAKWALFLAMAILTVVALWGNERFLFNPADPEWKHISGFRGWLFFHGIAAAVALLIGPFQFSARLRRTHLAVHRLLGRTYAVAVAIAAPLGFYIGYAFEPWPFNFTIELLGVLWFACTAIAVLAARSHQVAVHRQWAARSYALAFTFVTARMPYPDMKVADFSVVLLGLIILSLFCADAIMSADAFRRRRTAA
jgi:uncharacterized membrane protein